MSKHSLWMAGPSNRNAGAGNECHSAVFHRGGAAANVRTEPVPVLGAFVQSELGIAVGTIGVDRVQHRFHFAAVEKIIATDQQNPPVGEDFRLVVEDNRVVSGWMFVPFGFIVKSARDGGLWYSSKCPIRVEVKTIRPSGSSAGSIVVERPVGQFRPARFRRPPCGRYGKTVRRP